MKIFIIFFSCVEVQMGRCTDTRHNNKTDKGQKNQKTILEKVRQKLKYGISPKVKCQMTCHKGGSVQHQLVG